MAIKKNPTTVCGPSHLQTFDYHPLLITHYSARSIIIMPNSPVGILGRRRGVISTCPKNLKHQHVKQAKNPPWLLNSSRRHYRTPSCFPLFWEGLGLGWPSSHVRHRPRKKRWMDDCCSLLFFTCIFSPFMPGCVGCVDTWLISDGHGLNHRGRGENMSNGSHDWVSLSLLIHFFTFFSLKPVVSGITRQMNHQRGNVTRSEFSNRLKTFFFLRYVAMLLLFFVRSREREKRVKRVSAGSSFSSPVYEKGPSSCVRAHVM